MIALIVVALGAVVAAVGTGLLAARASRTPRIYFVAWAFALFGLAIGLGGAALGYLAGFGEIIFRAMEFGAALLAPLSLCLAMVEVAGRSLPARFAMRLALSGIGVIAIVILGTDPLNPNVTFSTKWPDPSVVYQIAPLTVLGFIAIFTAVAAVITFIIALTRSSRQGLPKAVTRPAVLVAVAAFIVVLPGLSWVASKGIGVSLPLGSAGLFAFCSTVTAILIWYAARVAGERDLSQVQPAPAPDRRPDDDWDDDGDSYRRARSSHQSYETGEFDEYRRRYGEPDTGANYPGLAELVADPADPADRQGRYQGSHGRYDDSGVYEGAGGYSPDSAQFGPPDQYPDDSRQFTQHGQYPDDSVQFGQPGPYADDSLQFGQPGPYADDSVQFGQPGPYADDSVQFDQPDRLADDSLQFGADPLGQAGHYLDDSSQFYPPAAGYGHGQQDRVPDWDDVADQLPAADSRGELFGQITIYTLIDGRVDEFDRLTEWVVGQVRAKEPETLVYIVHAVPTAPMQRILYEVYRDRVAHEEHLRRGYVKTYTDEQRPFVLATNVIELGLQQAKVSPLPSISTISDILSESGIDLTGITRSGQPGSGLAVSPGHDHPRSISAGSPSPEFGRPPRDDGFGQPEHGRPGHDQPGYDRAGYEQPGYEQPGYEQPGYDRDGQDQVHYDEPGDDRPYQGGWAEIGGEDSRY